MTAAPDGPPATAAVQHQPPKPGVIKMGSPREEVLPPTTATTVHDYTTGRGWGHDITYRPEDGGKVLRGSLWSATRLREGDYLILANGDRTTRYRVTEARWCVDPGDMYHFTAEFAPRQADDGE